MPDVVKRFDDDQSLAQAAASSAGQQYGAASREDVEVTDVAAFGADDRGADAEAGPVVASAGASSAGIHEDEEEANAIEAGEEDEEEEEEKEEAKKGDEEGEVEDAVEGQVDEWCDQDAFDTEAAAGGGDRGAGGAYGGGDAGASAADKARRNPKRGPRRLVIVDCRAKMNAQARTRAPRAPSVSRARARGFRGGNAEALSPLRCPSPSLSARFALSLRRTSSRRAASRASSSSTACSTRSSTTRSTACRA